MTSHETRHCVISPGTFDEVLDVAKRVPELLPDHVSRQAFEERFKDRMPHLLVARHDEQIVGFKMGYVLSNDTFYSWLGGVLPSARHQGVASALMEAQENWVQQAGYNRIEVKSMNRYPAMIGMMLRRGYQIVGIENAEEGPETLKILFRKDLKGPEFTPPTDGQ